MTNLQLLLSIGIPSLLVILGWLHQNQRIGDLQGEIKDVRGEIKDVRGEIKDVRGEIKDVRDELRAEIRSVRSAVDNLAEDYRQFYGLEQRLEGRVDELSKRVV